MSLQDQTHAVVIGPNGQKKVLKPSQVRAEMKRLQKLRDKAHKKAVDAATEAQANEAKKIVERRTVGGEDYERKPFGAYSPRYAKEKGSSKVDLKKDGDLLASLSVTKLKSGVYRLAFGPSFRKQVRGLARGRWPLWGDKSHMRKNQRPKRRAMGTVADEDIKQLAKKGHRAYQRVLRQELKR